MLDHAAAPADSFEVDEHTGAHVENVTAVPVALLAGGSFLSLLCTVCAASCWLRILSLLSSLMPSSLVRSATTDLRTSLSDGSTIRRSPLTFPCPFSFMPLSNQFPIGAHAPSFFRFADVVDHCEYFGGSSNLASQASSAFAGFAVGMSSCNKSPLSRSGVEDTRRSLHSLSLCICGFGLFWESVPIIVFAAVTRSEPSRPMKSHGAMRAAEV